MATTRSLEGYIIDDRYTVCKSLQSGFYGATWLATDAKDNHKDVCLKVAQVDENHAGLSIKIPLDPTCNKYCDLIGLFHFIGEYPPLRSKS